MWICKLSDGRLCELHKHDTSVCFDARPGWSLVVRPIGERPLRQSAWWVQSTQIQWRMEIRNERNDQQV